MYHGNEAHARERIRELRAAAADVRFASSLAAAQRWGRLARWAERRERRAQRAAAVQLGDSYSLTC